MPAKSHTLYTRRFMLVCMSSLLFSASYNMLIPDLPSYLEGLGGSAYIGLIIALFTLTAGISRPFSGKLTDTIGRKPIMLIGAGVSFICCFLYPLLPVVWAFLFLRGLHGFSTGFNPTATAAYVTDMIPANRWGEALGVQSLFFSTGLALGPALGSFVRLYFSFDTLFYSASFVALIAILCIWALPETLRNKQAFHPALLKIKAVDIIEKAVLLPAIITFLAYLAFGVILTLIPDWSIHLGIVNTGLFFMVFTISSLLIRFIAGRLSDRYGRIIIINTGLVLLLVSLFIMGNYTTVSGLLIGAGVYGLAMGVLTPGLNAWTVDLSNPDHKGKAMATLYIALEAGIGLGALISGFYYQSQVNRIPIVFYSCAFMAFIAFLIMVFRGVGLPSKQRKKVGSKRFLPKSNHPNGL
ncbi:MAG: MFS transporter [Saonia sp.]